MYSLFALLFRKNYWLMLLRGDTWSEAWLSLRRVHKDKRARKHLRSIALMLLIPCLCALYVMWLAGSGAWFVLPFVVALVWWRNRRHRKEEAGLHIAPQPEPIVRELSSDEQRALRAFFAQRALFFAVMAARSGSEQFLKEKALHQSLEVIARRRLIDLLRSSDLWDRMAPRDREAMLLPDGHWKGSLIHEVGVRLELVRLLRWILRIDYYLPVIGRQLRGDFAIAHQIVETPEKVMDGTGLVSAENLETAKGAAENFYARCIAECLTRRYYSTQNEEMTQWAEGVSASLKGQHHEDLLLGDKLVSETDEPTLRWATELARTRFRFLSWALKLREGAALPEGPLSVFEQDKPIEA
jgi:hypothetical protein